MRAIGGHARLHLQVVVTGTHLTRRTDHDIEAAGFEILDRVPMQNMSDVGRSADVAALGRGVIGLGETLVANKPDVVVVLGDRIEALAGALAASVGGVLLAHIHGGDRAEGVADEAMRHAISKLAHLHFPATKSSAKRLIRMGEDPAQVHVVGSPAIDTTSHITPGAADPDAPDVLVMQHPIGGRDAEEKKWMLATLAATQSTRRIVMAPNGDPGSAGIRAALRERRIAPVEHLPHERFLSLLAGTHVMVGNSSTGLIEAAALRVPVVNIGSRQAGREKPGNVVDCDYGTASVRAAVVRARALDLRRMRHPYGDGQTGQRIATILASADLNCAAIRKVNQY